MPTLDTDLVGRVKRLPLKPSAYSALLPMFEAVSNGLHAIDDRHKETVRSNGFLEIEVLRADTKTASPPVIGFVVTDNGIGFNDENYHSFMRPDSQHKMARGGKGVGRLGWLKVFKDIRVESTYVANDNVARLDVRYFDFVLQDNEQVVLLAGAEPQRSTGTRITLKRFDPIFGGKCPIDPITIRQRIIGHFIQVLATDVAPSIVLVDGDERTDLRQAFQDLIRDSEDEKVTVRTGEGEDGEQVALTIRHMRAAKAIRSDANHKNYNWMFLSAHQRAVDETAIDEAIGLKALDGEDVYVGCVFGDYLDEHVNAERTAFTFDKEENRAIRRALMSSIMRYLDGYVSRVKETKRTVARRVLEEYPQFLYLQGEMETFIDGLAPSAVAKEQVFVEMCRDRFRRNNQAHRTELELRKAPAYTEEVQAKLDQYQKFVEQQQRGVLAEYVLLRKSVIDILDKYMGFQEHKDAHHLEEAIHKLIVPMRRDSARMEINEHHLWLLDDRLAFFSYFASDRALKTYVDDPSKERPDVAFFYDTCFAWQEQEAGNTVVLVEFKRPGRDDYNGESNPVRQLIGYINKIRSSSSLKDSTGKVFSPRLKNAAFHCYVVADITETLLNSLGGLAFHSTPDEQGLVGYLRNPDAFVEIVSYSKLLSDAKMRNAIFFQKLGITDIDPKEDDLVALNDDFAKHSGERRATETEDSHDHNEERAAMTADAAR